MKTNTCIIKIESFEGPFNLLFHLIEKNKFDIYDIAISDIADQYMDYLFAMQELDLDVASEFLVLAATLLQIKSKMLLPNDKKDNKEEKEDIDPEEELVRKLKLYKKYKDFTEILRTNEVNFLKVIYKLPEDLIFQKEFEPITISFDIIMEKYLQVLKRKQDRSNNVENKMLCILEREKVSLKSKIKDVIKSLTGRVYFKFSEVFCLKKKSKVEVVTGFLAILELLKLKRIKVLQKRVFSDIIVYNNDMELEDLEDEMIS